MVEEDKYQKKFIIEEPPQVFQKLTKQILNLDDLIASKPSINKLGSYGISLDKLKKKSIYKRLLGLNKENNLNYQLMKETRNKYLKKLVESNSFFFPKELGLDEYKRPMNSKEDKYARFLKHLEEISKKDKNSRKSTINNNTASRKESFLDNKRKRSDSIYEEKGNKKMKKKEKEREENNEDNEENGEEQFEENEEASYNNENYGIPDEDDSQNYNYSEGDGGNDD